MGVIGILISVAVTLAVAVGVGALMVTTILGAVRGLSERQANRPWARVFMLLVSLGLGVMLFGLGYSVGEMLSHLFA